MKLARAFMRSQHVTEDGAPGVWWWGGSFWVWYGDLWQHRTVRDMEDEVWRWGEDVWYASGDGMVRRWNPTRTKVEDVVRALAAVTRAPWKEMPTGAPEGWDPLRCVAFRDVVVNVESGEEVERTGRWVSSGVCPMRKGEGGTREWERTVREWSQGEEAWERLLQEWMGYCLMGYRRKARWMLMYGKVRSGKGTISKLMGHLCGGEPWYATSSLTALAGRFGLDGLQHAKVLAIDEAQELDREVGHQTGAILKMMLGEDPMVVEAKWEKGVRNVVVNPAIMMSANEMPNIPNRGKGISSKMLVLEFRRSHLGKEDEGLLERLKEEAGGIAEWALEGAKRVLREGWTKTQAQEELEAEFRRSGDPVACFVEDRLVENERSFLPSSVLERSWEEWARKNKVKVYPRSLSREVANSMGGGVRLVRRGKERVRGLVGVGLRRNPLD